MVVDFDEQIALVDLVCFFSGAVLAQLPNTEVWDFFPLLQQETETGLLAFYQAYRVKVLVVGHTCSGRDR